MNPSTLQGIADNKPLLEAVKAEILKQFEAPSEGKGLEALSNEHLGEFLRARLTGIKAIDLAFKEIARHATAPPQQERVNRGR